MLFLVEKDFFVELMNYTNVFMYLPKTPFIWHLSSGENRGFEAFVSIYKWNVDSLYKLKSNYISKRREKLEFRKTQLGDSNTAQILEEKEFTYNEAEKVLLDLGYVKRTPASGSSHVTFTKDKFNIITLVKTQSPLKKICYKND